MTGITFRRFSRPAIAVIAAAAVYVLFLSWLCTIKYYSFGYDDFDLAIDAQSTWNICHGSIESSIHRIPFLGNHMRLILFPLAPFYALFGSPLFFLYLQTLGLGLAGWGIFLIAREQISERWAALFSIAFLVYPPVIHLNLYEFHPIAFVVPFFIFMFHFYLKDRFRLFCTFLGLAMLCQENIALVPVAMGIFALVNRKSRKWVLTLLLAGIVYFWLAVMVVMPRMSAGTIQLYTIYGHMGGSVQEIIGSIIMHPLKTLGIMFNADKLNFLSVLFGPLGYLSLLAPTYLIPLLPIVAQRLLSARPSETTIVYHYQAEFIPFIFVSAILGTRRILKYRPGFTSRLLAAILAIFPLAALLTCHVLPRIGRILETANKPSNLTDHKQLALGRIENDAAVLATFEFLPQLSNRRHLYSLHHVYTGHYTLSTTPYPTPGRLDYVLLDTMDRLTFSGEGYYAKMNCMNLQRLLDDEWQLLENIESFLVFSRTPGDRNENYSVTEHHAALPAPPAGWRPESMGNATLLSYRLSEPNGEGISDLSLVLAQGQ